MTPPLSDSSSILAVARRQHEMASRALSDSRIAWEVYEADQRKSRRILDAVDSQVAALRGSIADR